MHQGSLQSSTGGQAMIRFTIAVALLAFTGAAHADETQEQAAANFNAACRGYGAPRDEVCGVAMRSMDRSTLDAISDCIKEGGHSDVVPCRQAMGHGGRLE
jgi:hypothetical protein